MGWQPDYITGDDLGAFIEDDRFTARLDMAATTASRMVDQFCNRQFGKVDAPQTRYYTTRPDWERRIYVVDVDDLGDATGLVVVVDGATLDPSQYQLEPRNAPVNGGRPFTRIALASGVGGCDVAATGLWGWSAVPVPVEQATMLQGSRLMSRQASPFGIAGSPDTGSEMRLLARVDPDVAVSLAPYVKARLVA